MGVTMFFLRRGGDKNFSYKHVSTSLNSSILFFIFINIILNNTFLHLNKGNIKG